MSSLLNDIHAEDVANYLNRNREFFHVFPNLLNELSIPHPKSGQEVSLLERQVFQLREQRDSLIDVQLRTSEHRSMYSYVRLSIIDVRYVRLSIDRCTATYVLSIDR